MNFMLNEDRGYVEMETQFFGRFKVVEKLDLHLRIINPEDTAEQYILHFFPYRFCVLLATVRKANGSLPRPFGSY